MSELPLELREVRAYRGRSIHCAFAAVAGRLRLSGKARAPDEAAAALQRLLPAFPARAGEAAVRTPELAVALLVARIALFLQNAAGAELERAAARLLADGEVLALSDYEVREVGQDAMRLAADVAAWAFSGDGGPPAALEPRVAEFHATARQWQLDQTTRAIVKAARRRNIPHTPISSGTRFVQLGQGARQAHIFESLSDLASSVGSKISTNKAATNQLLRQLGVPVPEQAVVQSLEHAREIAAQAGFPLVVKPSHGMQSIGVTAAISGMGELDAAFRRAAQAQAGGVLLERHVAGDDHRLLVIGGRLRAAAKRVRAHVLGDGVHTVAQLVELANRDPRRGRGFEKPLVRIVLDAEAERMLARQGLRASEVPARGARVELRSVGSLATGGTAEDVTAQVHPDVRGMAELAARSLRLDVAGIDYLTPDISRSWREAGGAVCEVNSCPGLRPHLVATGSIAGLLDAMLDQHFPGGADGRIPTAAITGTSGKTTTARMVAAMLEASGRRTALVCSDGVFVGGEVVGEGDCAGGRYAAAAMLDPRPEAAVLELARGGLVRSGVPVDAVDVGAVTNVSSNHIGQDGIDSIEALASVKALVPQAAVRWRVLNAEDAHCVRMGGEPGAPVCWVAADPQHPVLKSHLGKGGLGVGVSDGALAILRGPDRQGVLPLADVPSTARGALRFNVANALFATAIGHALGLPLDAIRSALAAFRNDFEHNPGRLNVARGGRCQVLLDRADSASDIEALLEAAAQVAATKRVLVMTAPGNRLDLHIAQMARGVAGAFDHYICYSWRELRGRAPEEVPRMLARALAAGGVPAQAISVLPDQDEAIGHALGRVGRGDLLAVVAYEVGEARRRIWRRLTAH